MQDGWGSAFWQGGGRMGERVRSHDWRATPLGDPLHWPPALRTAVSIVLNSRFPQALVWGPGLVTIYNDAFRPILGGKPEALGRSFRDVWAEAWDSIGPIVDRAFAGEATFIQDFPLVVRRRDEPEQAWFTFCYSPVRDESGAVVGMIDTVIETTDAVLAHRGAAELNARLEAEVAHRTHELLAAQEALRQSQKMEAVGQLAGGIAHDFNNMLAVVISGLNLLQRRLARGDTDVGAYIEGAMDGAARAAALTQRLLAFSRRQPLAPEVLDPNRLVRGMEDLLTRTLGETIDIEFVTSAGLWAVDADANQLENVLLNMAVNARDAMPDGGRLTIETANIHVDDAYAAEAAITPGQYVMIAVTDTGTGMAPEVVAKAFDPFFTTKEVGKGTGLGLSQAFGFARQSGGHIRAYSEVGVGTSLKLYLPRFHGKAQNRAAVPLPRTTVSPTGSAREIVLVVEDEERVRTFTVETLRELGYTVLHAADGRSALRLIDGAPGTADPAGQAGRDVTLLLTDIVMPGMTGRQLADAARARLPELKVLYTTGYSRNAVIHNGVLDPGTNLLTKPFGIDQLAAKVRSVLDAPG
ncbi:ATP-binding protein [Azospirillum picis]|uniref:histidine kinase n=1 Tax=Azospirillum picis TaxID=488438 RepID=A0ABU0MCQ4_9PROT|nr:ATP-binding protein [Azospirillum picis]MBP2297793.1 signal transduction histidine kinase/CheY-like chemotaxis protein [Azospirillum picis]MDQ0531184.1 signal transduction histidine kinase/CheY-like chemotaxis protein [Azospirillum picis]